jgi:fluoride ion exporter CrcB/FEX
LLTRSGTLAANVVTVVVVAIAVIVVRWLSHQAGQHLSSTGILGTYGLDGALLHFC